MTIRLTKAKGSKHSPEFIKQILREHLAGDPASYLAEKYQVSKNMIQKWADGTSRGHLLFEVEEEIRKGTKKEN